MKNQLFKNLLLATLIVLLAGLSSCNQQNTPATAAAQTQPVTVNTNFSRPITESEVEKMSKDELISYLKQKSAVVPNVADQVIDMKNSLSFDVRNDSGKALYVACFYWMKDSIEAHWRWDKSKVYKIEPGSVKMVVIDSIPDSRDRNWTFGYLGVFDDEKSAQQSTFQRVNERKLIDLDLLVNLKGKQVVLYVRKYGLVGNKVWYKAESYNPTQNQRNPKILDFFVENKTGKDLYVTCFIYEQPDMANEYSSWTYTKSSVHFVKNNDVTVIKIPEVFDDYKVQYMRGVLGLFEKSQQRIAQDSTFELTDQKNKISVGLLSKLKGKKIVLDVESYGVFGGQFDYSLQPASFLNRRTKKIEPVGRQTRIPVSTKHHIHG